MLIAFGAKNFRSFADEFLFSMEAAPKQKGLDYSVKTVKVGKKLLKSLSSSIIYGPNAAGKTSVICALDLLKNLVLRGNIRDSDSRSENPVAMNLSLIPDFTCSEERPVTLFISFCQGRYLFDYTLSFNVGLFGQADAPRFITKEILRVNDVELFNRDRESVTIGNLKSLKDSFSQETMSQIDAAKALANGSLSDQDLFLANGFKSIFGKILYPTINEFFQDSLMTFCNLQDLKLSPSVMGRGIFTDGLITEAAHAFGSDANDLGFYKEKDDSNPEMISKVNGRAVYSKVFESLGTLRFINIFPAVVMTLMRGGTLVVDELDNSLHPMAVMSIINLFHNDDINKNGAQLIFNSQNPLYLNNNLFRRDEIKFVDRTSNEKGSVLYSLSDFGTRGTSARKGKDYMENYFIDKYGAIKQIDFTDLFERIMGGENAS